MSSIRLNLRAQLLLVSLSLLILPWALFLFIVELDKNLIEGHAASSGVQSAAVASRLSVSEYWHQDKPRPDSKTLLATVLNNAVLLDGYAHDWSTIELKPREFLYPQNKVTLEQEDVQSAVTFSILPATRFGRLYLFVSARDNKLTYHRRGSRTIGNGDRVIIRVLATDGTIRRYTFRWEAPGETVGRYYGPEYEGERPVLADVDYKAVLAETADGFNIELRMPEPLEGLFALSIVDVDDDGVERWTGMFNPAERDDIGQLKVVNDAFNAILQADTEPGMRLRVFDAQGWLIADSDQRLPDAALRDFNPVSASLFDAVLYRFIAWSLEKKLSTDKFPGIDNGKLGKIEIDLFQEISQGARFLRDRYGRVFLTSVREIKNTDQLAGYLLVQYPRVSLTAFTETAMLRLVKIFGVAVLLVALVLLAFASLVSWRVRKLRDSIERAVSRDGQITGSVNRSQAPDEIGDLSRSFHGIIERLGNYTGYLQTLGSRLSHELRTPLSVVTTSLENIDADVLDERTAVSIDRAGMGAARLQQLIRNLSEASSLEQTITRSEKTPLDLKRWVVVAREVYDNTYLDRDIALHINADGNSLINASVDLLHQMLDKLMSNAVDFSVSESRITIGLQCDSDTAIVSVENQGAGLPVTMASELFEPMVTERNFRDDQPHMGLGLYIVKLIADYHDATVGASDIPLCGAVQFRVEFPLLAGN